MPHKNPFPPCASFPCADPKCCAQGYKYTWPNVLGLDSQRAKDIILKDNPLVTVVFVHKGDIVVDDFCCNRVQVHVNEKEKVVHVPSIG
ncbi:hypothetical protein ACJIZ3_010182 [Penstemon smallii]|uniref:Uncharacterized protein n=1 Tax=Penstemon smallii TaxID=265156 RepID=A0ABD3TEL5_9LAMI